MCFRSWHARIVGGRVAEGGQTRAEATVLCEKAVGGKIVGEGS